MDEPSIFRLVFISILTSLVLTPGVIWLALKVKLVDVPNSAPHKRHLSPMPLAGGVILFAAFVIVTSLQEIWVGSDRLLMLGGFALVFLFGLVDDWKGMRPRTKLMGQIIAAAIVILGGVQVRLFHSETANIVITMLWLVGITNAVNFVDSMDGLALGLTAVTAGFFMLVTNNSQQILLTQLSIILLGASIACYYLNALPARIFLGDSGSQFLGFSLATIGLVYAPVGYSPLVSWYVPILLLGVPIFDTTLVVFSRLRRGLPVYRANLDHTYHRLVKLGLSSNRAILTLHFVALLLDCLAFIALNSTPLVANSLFGLVIILGLGSIALLDGRFYQSDADPKASPQTAPQHSAPQSGPEIH